jgi:hypothetical protein
MVTDIVVSVTMLSVIMLNAIMLNVIALATSVKLIAKTFLL